MWEAKRSAGVSPKSKLWHKTANHLEERLLHQAQARAPYTPLWGGHLRSIPQWVILAGAFDVFAIIFGWIFNDLFEYTWDPLPLNVPFVWDFKGLISITYFARGPRCVELQYANTWSSNPHHKTDLQYLPAFENRHMKHKQVNKNCP